MKAQPTATEAAADLLASHLRLTSEHRDLIRASLDTAWTAGMRGGFLAGSKVGAIVVLILWTLSLFVRFLWPPVCL